MQRSSSDVSPYIPAEDTFFFAQYVERQSGRSALEIGTGSGCLTKILEKRFTLVVGTDIDYDSLKRQQDKITNPVCCDGASALGRQFDLVICNLPYLPSDKVVDWATDGGPEGLLIPLRIVGSARECVRIGGKMLLLTSSLANYDKFVREIESMSFAVRIIGKKRLFFEELLVIEATMLS